MTTGKLIKQKRFQAGMSQTQLAKLLKVKPQQISNIERDIAALPKKYYKKVSKILSIHKYEFEEIGIRLVCEQIERAFK